MICCTRALKSLTRSSHKAALFSTKKMVTCQEDDLLLFHKYSKTDGKESLSLHFNNEHLDKYKEYIFPFKEPVCGMYHHRIVGSINGVLCVSDDQMVYTDNAYLWNPLTGEHVSLPLPRVQYSTHGGFDHALGFGFNKKTKDFNVIRLVHLLDTGCMIPPEVDIYRAKTHKWVNISHLEVPYLIGSRQSPVYLNGACHWLATNLTESHPTVASFDFENEEFRYTAGPTEAYYGGFTGEAKMTHISIYKGSLAIVCLDGEGEKIGPFSIMRDSAEALSLSTRSPAGTTLLCYEHYPKPMSVWSVWVLKEHGTWTKQLSMWGYDFERNLLGFGKNGEIIVTAKAGYVGCAYSADGSEIGVKVVDIDGAASWASPVFSSSFRESHVVLRRVKKERVKKAIKKVDEIKAEACA